MQKWVVEQLLKLFPSLSDLDVRSTSMGAGGVDVQMSSAAFRLFPFNIECKNLASSAVYKLYEQASSHKGKGEPLLILKANRKRPLAIVDADYFMALFKER